MDRMTRKRHRPEEIVAKLRQVDVLVSQGRSVAEAIRSIAVTMVASMICPPMARYPDAFTAASKCLNSTPTAG